ncbi:hypothetical protein ACIGBH_25265 [Streptomyces sp. NPDC085929]|uniref:hypothetical protein n=1 Tax=Streptomyces sp. NPDC085929 TaxID=3365739 RepID=UPI0037D32A42
MNRAALFDVDVDDTLTDTNHLDVTAWWEALRQGHRIPVHDLHRVIALPGEDLLGHFSETSATAAATTG